MSVPTVVPDVRLVITGHTAEGRGQVVSDTEIGPMPGLSADSWQAYVLWALSQVPTLPDDGLSAVDPSAAGPGSIRLVQCVVYPDNQAPPAGDAAVLAAIQRTPGDQSAMHYTNSLDLVIVIDGEVEVVLDDQRTTLRQGDFLVQNGTRHEWRNHGDVPARLAVVVIGAEHRGF
jgi:quercetin dioxygenase-like cupin family protein